MINLGARMRMSPNESFGPSYRSPSALVKSGYQWPGGSPTMVYRTPDPVIWDEEPGGAVFPGLQQMKFRDDGLVPINEMSGFGADASVDAIRAQNFATAVKESAKSNMIETSLVGAAIGLLFSSSGNRLWGTGLGALAGFVGGVVIGRVATRTANMVYWSRTPQT